MLEAAQAARQDGQAVSLQPGQSFETWYRMVEPYLKPLVIGPPFTLGSTLTLAVAAQFPTWLCATDRLRFAWPPDLPPVVLVGQQLNARLYRLTPHLPPELHRC